MERMNTTRITEDAIRQRNKRKRFQSKAAFTAGIATGMAAGLVFEVAKDIAKDIFDRSASKVNAKAKLMEQITGVTRLHAGRRRRIVRYEMMTAAQKQIVDAGKGPTAPIPDDMNQEQLMSLFLDMGKDPKKYRIG